VVLWYVIALVLSGLIVGALARLALPGPDPMTIPGTIVLGLAGSFLGGVMAWLFIGRPAGLVFSVLGATALLYARRRFVEHRPLTGPGSREIRRR
jgi:uncharacterized membrane protein YeaQ/YmgE (transglycosylase-associated protein family)